MPILEYTITVENEKFILVADHFNSDAPNYFTSYFFGDFAEGGCQEMILHRNPILFRAVREHLMGYEIGLLTGDWYPSHWSRDTALKNLLVDADFYGLERLIGLVKDTLKTISTPKRYVLYVSGPKDPKIPNLTNLLRTSNHLTIGFIARFRKSV